MMESTQQTGHVRVVATGHVDPAGVAVIHDMDLAWWEMQLQAQPTVPWSDEFFDELEREQPGEYLRHG